MKVTAKAGFEIDIEITGYKQAPVIKVSPFSVGGRRHPGGNANIQHWKEKGLDRGLFLGSPRAYIQVASDGMEAIDSAVGSLPQKKYYIHLETHTVNADGYEIEVEKWHIDKVVPRAENGYIIAEGQITGFLKRKGIRRIEVGEAVKLFESEHDMELLRARQREASARVKAAYDDDVAEEGEAQARRNWGIPG